MDAGLNAPDEELPRGIFADVSGSSLREELNESEEILNGNTIPRFLSTPISEGLSTGNVASICFIQNLNFLLL